MHICELCRALLPNSANFCGQCGYALGASTILPTASNLLIANSEYSSNQIATVDNNIATGLSDARHELQMSPPSTIMMLMNFLLLLTMRLFVL